MAVDTSDISLSYSEVQSKLDRHAFVQSWELAFKRRLPEAVYAWIFCEENHLYVMRQESTVVAGYALLDQTAVWSGKQVRIALCNNVFVHPAFEGRNLFVLLGKYALSQAEARGVKLAMGMPNPNAVPGHKRVGWTFMDPVPFLETRHLQLQTASSQINLIELTRRNYATYAQAIEELSFANAKDRLFSVIKTQEYFKWRYLGRPQTEYRIFVAQQDVALTGYIVYKYYEPLKRLHIVDLEASDPLAIQALLSRAGDVSPNVERINTWGSTTFRQQLLDLGFTSSTEASQFIFIRPYHKEPVPLKGAVHIVLGDNDVY